MDEKEQLKKLESMRIRLDRLKDFYGKLKARNLADLEESDREIAAIDRALVKVRAAPSLTLPEGLKIISEI